MKINRKVLFIILPALLISTGCLNRKAIIKDTFLLSASREIATSQNKSDAILVVLPFSIAPAFEGKGVVSRVSENRYESDFYNEYFVSPAQMITERTRNWLSESGCFAQVLSPVSSVQPTHILEGHVRTMVLDVRDSAKPRAELEITFFLLEQLKHDRTIRFQQTYSVSHAMESGSVQDYMAAQSWCLRDILEKLESDLVSNL
ncbi:MAG: ABC-type transport auxiliary lipoprotein family protein [Phycisphaerae bacterium]|nr:ABC-type transport auxiliary lipoprotein family protein [Phycisphaerae bacterium]